MTGMYDIYHQKTGQKIGCISEAGQVCCTSWRDQQKLEAFLRRTITVRETADGEIEAVAGMEEEAMCFWGWHTLTPGARGYLTAALDQLSIFTDYSWTISRSTTS